MRNDMVILSSLALLGYVVSRAVSARAASLPAASRTRASIGGVAMARSDAHAADSATSGSAESRARPTWTEAEILAEFGGQQ